MSAMSNYELDVNEWTKEQADALRRRAPNELDWDNLAEEIEVFGQQQPAPDQVAPGNPDPSSLEVEISAGMAVRQLARLDPRGAPSLGRSTRRSPSLRPLPADYLPKAYARARARALDETGLYRLPETCPWTIEQILDGDFLP